MNEAIVNEMTAISELNRVDGFDPSRFMRKLTEVDDNGQPSERMYLEVAYRKLWFRLKHPEGAIRKFIREVNDQFAIMEARVYLDRRDPEESYIANAIVKRYFHPEDKLGDKYLEIAETAAVGRALADAGFGIQFTDSSENPESGVVDAPIGMPTGTSNRMPSGHAANASLSQVNTITGEVMHTPQTPAPAAANAVPNSVSMAAAMPQTQTAQPVPQAQPAPATPVFIPTMPVEQILPQMTMQFALNYEVDCGVFKGKKLGQVAQEKPQSLEWYVNAYKGNNNILRAAAKYLLDKASA
jgi:hypothetical protein